MTTSSSTQSECTSNHPSDIVNPDAIINPLLDNGYLPHAVIRVGIRRQLADRLQSIATTSLESAYESKMNYVKLLRSRPIAIETSTANEQHYEVGTSVLKGMLGPRMKYSACLYEKGGETLAQAEMAMLRLYVERAELKDGMSILDLGYVFHSKEYNLRHVACRITCSGLPC